MRPQMCASENRITGMPRRYWGKYLDEIVPMNDEQADCISKMMDVLRRKYWSLVVLGTVGNGKTTLACGLVSMDEYAHSYSTKYTTQESLVDECRATFASGASEASVIEKYQSATLLVIDELTTAGWTEYTKSLVQKILRYRHGNRLATVLIGNLDVDTFKGMFDDHILSRLREGETQIMTASDMRIHGEF